MNKDKFENKSLLTFLIFSAKWKSSLGGATVKEKKRCRIFKILNSFTVAAKQLS